MLQTSHDQISEINTVFFSEPFFCKNNESTNFICVYFLSHWQGRARTECDRPDELRVTGENPNELRAILELFSASKVGRNDAGSLDQD